MYHSYWGVNTVGEGVPGFHGYWAMRLLKVPHILRQGPTLYKCHLPGPVIFTPVIERFAVKVHSYLKLKACKINTQIASTLLLALF